MMTQFRVAKDHLPEDSEARYEALHRYFCELQATAVDVGAAWDVTLRRPGRVDAYVDPGLAEGLAWYARRVGPVDVPGIALAVHRSQSFQLSLYDSWTLWSWSLWLSDRSLSDLDVTVLHVDDHDDLMTPRLLNRHGAVIDALTGEPVRLSEPPSVEAAIRSGAVGIGSFMAPFLRSARRVDVRHLCATSYSVDRPGTYRIASMDVDDMLLHRGDVRPGVRLECAPPGEDPDRRYSVTDDLSTWVRDLRPGPVLLHVDMDYFNNRFNWSSDWEDGERHDPSLPDTLVRIEHVVHALQRPDLHSRIEDVAIALSPGFFPAELWKPSIELFEQLLTSR